MHKVAIVGAGIAGAALSRRLVDAGMDVTVFEKSRGTGGRLSSARLGTVSGDLGCDYIEAQSDVFQSYLNGLASQGVVTRWEPAVADFNGEEKGARPLWVAPGRNSALTRHLLSGAKLVAETRIGVIWPDREGVLLRDDQGQSLGYFDSVICTAPAPQSVPLLEAKTRFAQVADRAITLPAWVKLFELNCLPEKLKHSALIEGGHPDFERLVVESSKAGRSGVVLKLQMTQAWTEANLSLSQETVSSVISELFEDWLGESVDEIRSRTHRWLYCSTSQPEPKSDVLWDEELSIGACGDWVNESGVEGSWLSAQRLADRVLSRVDSAA